VITEHLQYLAKVVNGKTIYDFGCGNLERTTKILEATKPSKVVAVDQRKPAHIPKSIEFVEMDMSKTTPTTIGDIAFVSWPINRLVFSGGPAWEQVLQPYKEIIYIGNNTGGTCCGSPEFWNAVSNREVLEVLPDIKETLIHYGSKPREESQVPAEEFYGIDSWKPEARIYQFTTDKFLTPRENN